MSRLVAFIIGSGANIGQHTAAAFKAKGYQVAVGSRKPAVEQAKKDGYLPVAVDIAIPATVKEAFATVNKELGPPSVVVFNAAVFSPPPTPEDPLSLSVETFAQQSGVSVSVFTAAKEAVAGFRTNADKDVHKTFIITGNPLPWTPYHSILTFGLNLQKVDEWRMMQLLDAAYAKEGFRFHFATIVSDQGGPLNPMSDFFTSGPQHAKVYTDLATRADKEDWDYRFTLKAEKWSKA